MLIPNPEYKWLMNSSMEFPAEYNKNKEAAHPFIFEETHDKNICSTQTKTKNANKIPKVSTTHYFSLIDASDLTSVYYI